jgi:hypothetical protein
MRKKAYKPESMKTLVCHVCNKSSSLVDSKTDRLTCYKCVSRASNPNSLFHDEVRSEDFARLVLGKYK